jgi:CHRD domain.
MMKKKLGLAVAAALLSTGAAHAGHFVANCWNAEEVPPTDSKGRAVAVFNVSRDGTVIDYQVSAGNLDNVVFAHIHLGAFGSNGPVVVTLVDPRAPGGGKSHGVLQRGTITDASLSGPLAGQPLSALLEAMQAGNTYVNVHTDDGIDPINTGPGDYRTGELRGQVRPGNWK